MARSRSRPPAPDRPQPAAELAVPRAVRVAVLRVRPVPGPAPRARRSTPSRCARCSTRLAETPVEAIVTQFAVELQEIAVLHLGLAAERPESLAQAAIAIDAMGAIVDAVGERFGPNAEPLRQAVAALRLGFVEVSSEIGQAGDAAPEA